MIVLILLLAYVLVSVALCLVVGAGIALADHREHGNVEPEPVAVRELVRLRR
jgi:hypothetical protein